MTYDPYQTYSALGAYPGAPNLFQTPYTAIQPSAFNPAAAWNPLIANQGMSPAGPINGISQQGPQGYNPQSQFSPYMMSHLAGQNPLLQAGLQNPMLQNPLLQNAMSNPFVAQQLAAQQIAAQQLAAQQYAAQQAAQQYAVAQQLAAQQQGLYPQQQGFYPQQGLYPQIGHIGLAGQQIGQPQIGQPGSPFGQNVSPFGQTGFPLAPQSWVGQAGQFGAQFGGGQVNPFLLAQLTGRSHHQHGGSGWSGFQG